MFSGLIFLFKYSMFFCWSFIPSTRWCPEACFCGAFVHLQWRMSSGTGADLGGLAGSSFKILVLQAAEDKLFVRAWRKTLHEAMSATGEQMLFTLLSCAQPDGDNIKLHLNILSQQHKWKSVAFEYLLCVRLLHLLLSFSIHFYGNRKEQQLYKNAVGTSWYFNLNEYFRGLEGGAIFCV